MAEYIFNAEIKGESPVYEITITGVGDRIVRCKDCVSFIRDENDFHDFMRGDIGSLCTSEDENGFCAWGERRSDG